MNNPYPNIHWLEPEDYKKARGQAKLQVTEALSVFNMHGFGIYIPGATDEIMQVMDDFALRLRGIDKPIQVTRKKNARYES